MKDENKINHTILAEKHNIDPLICISNNISINDQYYV